MVNIIIKCLAIMVMILSIIGLFLLVTKVKSSHLGDLLEVKGFDFDTYSVVKEGGYTKYYECQGIDIKNMPLKEREAYYGAFHQFIKLQVKFSNIYLSVPFHIDTSVYDGYEVSNINLQKIKEIKIKKMQDLNANKLDDKCYLIIYAKTKEEMEQYIYYVETYLCHAIPLRELSEVETLNVMQISYNPYLLEKRGGY